MCKEKHSENQVDLQVLGCSPLVHTVFMSSNALYLSTFVTLHDRLKMYSAQKR